LALEELVVFIKAPMALMETHLLSIRLHPLVEAVGSQSWPGALVQLVAPAVAAAVVRESVDTPEQPIKALPAVTVKPLPQAEHGVAVAAAVLEVPALQALQVVTVEVVFQAP
jgi:hypothetical protein